SVFTASFPALSWIPTPPPHFSYASCCSNNEPARGAPAPQFCHWGRPGRSTVYQTEYWAGVSCKSGADAGNSDWPRSLASSSRCWLRVAVGRGRGRIDMGAPVHPPDLGSGEL